MLRFTVVLLTVILLNALAVAQDNLKVEVFGGYSFEHIQPCDGFLGCGNSVTPRPFENYNGWNASVTAYFSKFLGATADFTGRYGQGLGGSGNPASRYSYMFGPVLAVHTRGATPFAHALFGLVSQRDRFHNNYDKFAWAVGGGFDVNVSPRLAVRPVELDYERVHVPGFVSGQTFTAAGFRYSGGIVFKF
jgi:opacity protein-like surface antigen